MMRWWCESRRCHLPSPSPRRVRKAGRPRHRPKRSKTSSIDFSAFTPKILPKGADGEEQEQEGALGRQHSVLTTVLSENARADFEPGNLLYGIHSTEMFAGFGGKRPIGMTIRPA